MPFPPCPIFGLGLPPPRLPGAVGALLPVPAPPPAEASLGRANSLPWRRLGAGIGTFAISTQGAGVRPAPASPPGVG